MVTTKLVTAEELWSIGEDDHHRYALIRGELYRMSPAGFRHGVIASDFHLPLAAFVRERGLGLVATNDSGFVLERDPDSVLGPDIAFVRADRLPPPNEFDGFLELPPDLAVEIISPSQSGPFVAAKVAAYLNAGVAMVVFVRPARKTVSVHRPGRETIVLGIGDVFDGEDVLPGFQLPLTELFRDNP